jgi:hypothetical protein
MIKSGLRKDIRIREVVAHINDDAFADATYDEMMLLMANH